MRYSYAGCCIDSDAESITDMTERERSVSFRTILKHVGIEALARVFPSYDWRGSTHAAGGLHMRNDWHVSYHKSWYRGRRCYYVRWSAIEFIFTEEAA
jgi:hypothetical protein